MRAAIVAALVLTGCARAAPPARPPGPVASALLGVAAELGARPPQVAAAWSQIDGIARQVAEHRRRAGGDLVDSLNAVVMGDLRFEREIDRPASRFVLLPSVIEERRGSCLGLGALYLALAETLGEPLNGVLVPGHFFVRAPGPPPRNVELLRRGEAMPGAWYRQKYGPWPAAPSAYDRPISVDELVAVHWFNAGNLRREEGDLAGAEQAYQRAATGFPAFAEAHASLGVVCQLRGELAEAAAAYTAASRARSDLPGLAENIALLQAEQIHSAVRPPKEPR